MIGLDPDLAGPPGRAPGAGALKPGGRDIAAAAARAVWRASYRILAAIALLTAASLSVGLLAWLLFPDG